MNEFRPSQEQVTIRILPPPKGKSFYSYNKVHRLPPYKPFCPMCEWELEEVKPDFVIEHKEP